jgi:hypothetical protein
MVVTVVPSFHYGAPLHLISSPHKGVAGPFVAGMPTDVPLWIAKTLHQRNLAQIHLPDWLSTTTVTETLHEERESNMLTSTLPYYYYEIARALNFCTPKPTQIVLQDLTTLRCDKLRQHFHELSRNELTQPRGIDTVGDRSKNLHDDDYDDDDDYQQDGKDNYDLRNIDVTGIASYEINRMGPFLQRAFSDYGFLTKRSLDTDTTNNVYKRAYSNSTQDEGGIRSSGKTNTSESQDSARKTTIGRSRLRRFRS